MLYHLSYIHHVNGAGDGNRTRIASLEGWSSAFELHLHMAAWENYDISTYGLTDRCSASELPGHMVGHTGLEPVLFRLSGECVNPLR